MLKSFDDILQKLKKSKKNKRIAVALPDNTHILEALQEVEQRDLGEALLVGPQKKIVSCAQEIDFSINSERIFDVNDEKAIAAKSVQLVRSGQADLLMKGRISTPILMKAVLDKDQGLRQGQLLSHVGVMEVATYDRLLAVSDGGINIAPNLDQKKAILNNMLEVLHGLNIAEPKIGLLSPIEKVNSKIQETVDAAKIQKLAEQGEFGPALVEGPMAMDVALSQEAAHRKQLNSKIAGHVDGLLVPSITVGNAVLKAMIYLAKAKIGGVVVGAQVPIILLSRADSPVQKICSIGLAIYLS